MALIYQNVTLSAKHRTKLKLILVADDSDLANLIYFVFEINIICKLYIGQSLGFGYVRNSRYTGLPRDTTNKLSC